MKENTNKTVKEYFKNNNNQRKVYLPFTAWKIDILKRIKIYMKRN